MLKEYSTLGAFVLGLLHVLEPCEDKAIVSLYVAWTGENLKHTFKLIVLYGLGMSIINIFFGFIVAVLGVNYLETWQIYLRMGAGIFTIIFGLYIIRHSHLFWGHCSLEHSHQEPKVKSDKAVLLFGLLRGLPLCPIEIAMLLWAASVRNIYYGTLLVASFSFGTFLSLIPFGIGAKGIFKFLNIKEDEKTKKFFQLIMGLFIVVIGIVSLFYNGH